MQHATTPWRASPFGGATAYRRSRSLTSNTTRRHESRSQLTTTSSCRCRLQSVISEVSLRSSPLVSPRPRSSRGRAASCGPTRQVTRSRRRGSPSRSTVSNQRCSRSHSMRRPWVLRFARSSLTRCRRCRHSVGPTFRGLPGAPPPRKLATKPLSLRVIALSTTSKEKLSSARSRRHLRSLKGHLARARREPRRCASTTWPTKD